MKKLLKVIDSVSEYSGSATRWVAVALVLVLSIEVVMRYIFNSPTIWAHLLSMMLGGTTVMLTLAYTDLHNGHTRIDIFYAKLSPRGKALLDAICAILFFFPLVGVLIYTSANWVSASFMEGEIRTESFWYPPAWPFRLVFMVGWCLFALQGLARFIRDFQRLLTRRGAPDD